MGDLISGKESALLRFITCGSVDDGKSTLMERLLEESEVVYGGHMGALRHAARKHGTQSENLDFALLADAWQADVEQGVTIDVAYHIFSTPRRSFIVADMPGHEQYTRNMVTGAPTAQAAVVVIDARKGVLTQTRRHSRIVSLLGIRQVAVAINKMDLTEWDERRYLQIKKDYEALGEELGFDRLEFIPMAALHGDNVVGRSSNMRWYGGRTLLEFLEDVHAGKDANNAFRMPVQLVNRPDSPSRGCRGRVAAGTVRPGDRVRLVPSGMETTVNSVVTVGGELPEALRGHTVALTFTDEVEVARGDVVCAVSEPVEAADQFEAHVVWMSPSSVSAGRIYDAKIHSLHAGASITQIKYKIDVNTGAHLAARSLGLNDIAVVNLSFDRPVPFEPYAKNRLLGGLILIDRLTHETVGAAMIHFALRRASNIHWQAIDVGAEARAVLKGQRARCFWFTGLPASGKSTIANLFDRRLHAAGFHTFVLDGDNVRHGLNRDLGFTEADRVENIRRVAEVARLMVDAGLIVIVSFISPFRAERAFARELFKETQFVEVFVDTPRAVCEQRDPKGLWTKARAGRLKNFTGIDSPYEPPEHPDVSIRTVECDAAEAAERLAQLAAGRDDLPEL